MNVEYTGRHYEVTSAIRKEVETGLAKIRKILGDRFEAKVILCRRKAPPQSRNHHQPPQWPAGRPGSGQGHDDRRQRRARPSRKAGSEVQDEMGIEKALCAQERRSQEVERPLSRAEKFTPKVGLTEKTAVPVAGAPLSSPWPGPPRFTWSAPTKRSPCAP